MKSFIAILALVAVAAAIDEPRARTNDREAVIVKQDADVFPDQYRYEYETSNGIAAQESGVLTNVGKENEGVAVQGFNSYINDEGQIIRTEYIADASGYQAQGAHIPTPPPVPEAIARAVAYILANANPSQEGSYRP